MNITTENQTFFIMLRPEKKVFTGGISTQSVLDEIQLLGICEIIFHEEAISTEKQLSNKETTSWFEIYLSSSVPIEEIKKVFRSLGQSEYTIFLLAQGRIGESAQSLS
jgi:hypothetical protein